MVRSDWIEDGIIKKLERERQSSLVEDKGVKRSVELFKDYHCKKCGSVDVDVFVSDNSLCLKCDDCNERVIFRTDDRKQGALEEQKKIISLIKKQKMVYVNNQKGCDKDSKWLEGAESTCDYLMQLIKEKERGVFPMGTSPTAQEMNKKNDNCKRTYTFKFGSFENLCYWAVIRYKKNKCINKNDLRNKLKELQEKKEKVGGKR